jgi:hypothetical protein
VVSKVWGIFPNFLAFFSNLNLNKWNFANCFVATLRKFPRKRKKKGKGKKKIRWFGKFCNFIQFFKKKIELTLKKLQTFFVITV